MAGIETISASIGCLIRSANARHAHEISLMKRTHLGSSHPRPDGESAKPNEILTERDGMMVAVSPDDIAKS